LGRPGATWAASRTLDNLERRGAGRPAVAAQFTAELLAPRHLPGGVVVMTMARDRHHDDPQVFSEAVREFYRAAIGGDWQRDRSSYSRDVRKAGSGLARLYLLAKDFRTQIKNGGTLDDMVATGANEAAEIIEALISGQDHPVWAFIEGASRARGHPKPTKHTLYGRYCVVGAERALMRAAGLSQSQARSAIVKECKVGEHTFTAYQLRYWHDEFRRSADKGPDAAANDIIAQAEALTSPPAIRDRILKIAIKFIGAFWSVPKPPNQDATVR
jgi:hypothetical protein